jgi:hypothetical protein
MMLAIRLVSLLILSSFPVWLVTGPFLPDLFLSLGALGILFFFMLIIGAWCLLKDRNYRLLFSWTIFLIIFFWFSFYPTFFERNFSHLIPFFIIIASYGF